MGYAVIDAVPIYRVVGRHGTLLLEVPRQAPAICSRYLIQAQRSEIDGQTCVEVELYDAEALPLRRVRQCRRGPRLVREAPRLIDVGVWCLGCYVRWQNQRQHDFNLLDAVDLVLRRELPQEVGYCFPARKLTLGTGVAQNFNA